jgi:hypothetical protein
MTIWKQNYILGWNFYLKMFWIGSDDNYLPLQNSLKSWEPSYGASEFSETRYWGHWFIENSYVVLNQ